VTERFGASGESSVAEKRIESEKLEIMYIVDDPFTALAFVYFYDYGTDVCGMLIAVLRRGSYIEQCYASYAGIMHSAAFMFSLQQLAGRDQCFSFTAVEYTKGFR